MSTLKKIDKSSGEGFDSSLNIFELPPTNVAINRSSIRELLPLTTITQDGPYVFRLFADNQFADLSRTFVYLELAIEKKKDNEWVPIEKPVFGTDKKLTSGDNNVAMINNIGQSFIKQLKLSMNNVECFDSGVLYAYRAYMHQELNYTPDVMRGLYEAGGYYRDDDDQNAIREGGNGIAKRSAIFAGGGVGKFMFRLYFDLGQQDNYMLSNTDIIFTIYRNSDDFLLHVPDKGDKNVYRVKVANIKLYVKTVDVTQSLNNAISSHLEKATAKYSLRRIEMRSVFLGKGRLDLSHNIFTSVIPRKLIIGFVSSDAFAGNRHLSPYVFEPAGVRTISVEANGHIYPAAPYSFDFGSYEFIRAFVDMYVGLGYADTNTTCNSININRFKRGWCFFVIPLTSTLDDSSGFELIKNGTTCIKVGFKDPIKDTGFEMVVWGEFDQVLSINSDRVLASDGTV